MHTPQTTNSLNKEKLYSVLIRQLEALTEGEPFYLSNLANAAALLFNALPNINWAGFYLLRRGELVLGPFQGNVACMRIQVGKGVCGTAVAKNEAQLVPDVHKFPGHIVCDSSSNSEIVIPICYKGEVIGVLDIDSPVFNRFNDEDKVGLESFARVLESACDWEETGEAWIS